MPWKRGPRDGIEYEHVEKHFRIKRRQWIYPLSEEKDAYAYCLDVSPHIGVRDQVLPSICFTWPNNDGFTSRFFENPDNLKKKLDEMGIKERPHYRKAYRIMQDVLARYIR